MAIIEADVSEPRHHQFARHPPTGRRADALLIGLLAAGTLVVHSLHYVLTTPFWLDETWVAVSTRLPLSAAPHVTSVSPIGWTLLLRTPFLGGEQALRLIPLVFSALSVVVAYLLGRTLAWRTRQQSQLAGTLAGLALLLAPSSLLRNDLKPYTADAFVTLSVLLLLSALERSWTRTRLVRLSAACIIGFLISTAAVFVAAATFAALIVVHLIRRDRQRVHEIAVGAAITGSTLGVVFLIFYQPHMEASLTEYWSKFYLPLSKGFGPTVGYLHRLGNEMTSYLGMGPLLTAVLLVTAGVVTVARSERPALAFTVPILLVEMMIMGAAKKYPLFEERTSHFLTVTLAVLAAIGLTELCSRLAGRNAIAAVTVLVLATSLFIFNVRHGVRRHTIAAEDVRTPTRYVAANKRATDVIVVSATADYGFSYYWPEGRPQWRPSITSATGFQTWFPRQPEIIFAADRDRESIEAALKQAVTRAAEVPAARIWIVRMHVTRVEDQLWQVALKPYPDQVDPVIPCSLLLLTPRPAGTEESSRSANPATCF